ncbi:hypothetical protein HanRHA438_Chr06g0274141 [Helianthus annuus]|nr:hypothetical protein HanIR_Chr06g0284981 [Helianthus annuus]KAJ0912423.1 hypothetical protein HanRHA438_Chr06g0274141 [Helianthus annuus]
MAVTWRLQSTRSEVVKKKHCNYPPKIEGVCLSYTTHRSAKGKKERVAPVQVCGYKSTYPFMLISSTYSRETSIHEKTRLLDRTH